MFSYYNKWAKILFEFDNYIEKNEELCFISPNEYKNLEDKIEKDKEYPDYDSMKDSYVPDFIIGFLKNCYNITLQEKKLNDNIKIIHPNEFSNQDKNISRPLIMRYVGMGHYLALCMLPIDYYVDTLTEEIFFVVHLGGSNSYDQNDSYEYFSKQDYNSLSNTGKLFDFETALKLLTNFIDFSSSDYNTYYVDYL